MTTEKPAWLSSAQLEGKARQIWDDNAVTRWSTGVLTQDNVEVFRALCRVLAVASAAAEKLEAEGLVIETPTGIARPHPCVRILNDAQKMALPWLQLFEMAQFGEPTIAALFRKRPEGA